MRTSHIRINSLIKNEKSKITDEELFGSKAYAAYLTDIAESVSKRYRRKIKVDVFWDESPNAEPSHTDNQIIRINAGNFITRSFNSRRLRAESITGINAHEIAHILYSDFQALNSYTDSVLSGKFYPFEPVVPVKDRVNLDEISAVFDSKNKPAIKIIVKCTQYVLNCIEDAYVESRICEAYPGIFRTGIVMNNLRYTEFVPSITRQIADGNYGFAVMSNIFVQRCIIGSVNNTDNYSGEYLDILHECEPIIDRCCYSGDTNVKFDAANQVVVKFWAYIRELIDQSCNNAGMPGGNADEAAQKILDDLDSQTVKSGSEPKGNSKPVSENGTDTKKQDKSESGNQSSGNDKSQKNTKNETESIQPDRTDENKNGSSEIKQSGDTTKKSDKPDTEASGEDENFESTGGDLTQEGEKTETKNTKNEKLNEPGEESNKNETSESGKSAGSGNHEDDNTETETSDNTGSDNVEGSSSEKNEQPETESAEPETSGEDNDNSNENELSCDSNNQSDSSDAESGTEFDSVNDTDNSENESSDKTGDNSNEIELPDNHSEELHDSNAGDEGESGYDTTAEDEVIPKESDTETEGINTDETDIDGGTEFDRSELEAFRNLIREMLEDDKFQDVTDEETERMKLEETDEIGEGSGGTVTKNNAYEGAKYLSAARDTERLLDKMAEDKVDEILENELIDELRQEAGRIRYGNAHKGIKVRINRINPVSDGLIAVYHAISPQLLLLSKRMQKQVSQILKDKREGGKNTGLYMGKRINIRSLKENDGRIFYNRRLPQDNSDIAVALLVDESGSMKGSDRITSARAASIVIYDFCINLGIPISVYGHSTSLYGNNVEMYAYADFDSYDKKDMYRIADMASRNGNRDGAALRFVAERLMKRTEEIKLFILISDGQPAAFEYYGTEAEADLRGIKREYKNKGITMFAAAIGDDREHINRIYGDGFFDITDLNKLPVNLTALISRYINKQ